STWRAKYSLKRSDLCLRPRSGKSPYRRAMRDSLGQLERHPRRRSTQQSSGTHEINLKLNSSRSEPDLTATSSNLSPRKCGLLTLLIHLRPDSRRLASMG